MNNRTPEQKKASANAFPCVYESWEPEGGLTTRDYFAITALNGILSEGIDPATGPADYAMCAYALADAMIAHSLNVPDTMAAQADEIASLKRRLEETQTLLDDAVGNGGCK